jgi:hypothetical protein
MVTKVLLNMMDNTKEICVIPTLASCIICTCSFDLWMSYVGFDTFVIVVSFINALWEQFHVTIGIFEVHNIASVTMANQVNFLLNSFSLLDKVIAYVKHERSNLNTLTFALTFAISCFALQLTCPFVGLCFGHAMSNATQYDTKNNEIYFGFS